MNALHKLSKQYFRSEITQQVFRNRRRELITAILDGRYVEQNTITNVASAIEHDTTLQIKAVSNPSLMNKKDLAPSKRKGMSKPLVFVLVCFVLMGLGLIFKSTLQAKFKKYQPAILNFAAELNLIEQSEADDKQISALQTQWNMILSSHQLTKNKVTELQALWGETSPHNKATFEVILKNSIKRWENDFDKEIEVSLTHQLMQSLNI